MHPKVSTELNKTPVVKTFHKFAYIDIIRGLAVLAVLLVHTTISFKTNYLPGGLTKVLGNGSYGVQLFFFASAFTIFYSYANRAGKETHADRNFFIRRFFRIAPLYYVALMYYLLQNGTGPSYWTGGTHSITYVGIIENLLFIHGVDPYYINSIVPGGWSITVEMFFYCMVPFLFRYIKNINGALYFLIGTLILRRVCNIVVLHFIGHHFPEKYLLENFTYMYLPNQLPVFAIGILFYFMVQDIKKISYKPLLILFFIALVEVLTKKMDFTDHLLLSFSYLLMALALREIYFDGFLSKIMRYIGKISFSMYLVHFAVIFCLEKLSIIPQPTNRNNNLILFVIEYLVVVIITTGIASITYKLIEVPAQNLGKRLIQKLEA